MSIKYAAYGSNLNLRQMKFRCPTAKILGDSEIKDYILLFRGINGKAVADIEPSFEDKVPVIVWGIIKILHKILDIYIKIYYNNIGKINYFTNIINLEGENNEGNGI